MKLKDIYLSLLIVLTVLYGGCSTSQPMPGPYSSMGYQNNFVASPIYSAYSSPQSLEHIVGPQETLWRISKTYDVDINTLMRVNNIRNPNALKSGQRLIIPSTYGPRPVIPLYPSRKWSHIVIHHTATDVGSAFSIDKMHHQRGFWNGLGYHFLIDNGTNNKADGQIEVGPRWVKQMDGAHCNVNGMNEHGIGIALVGNFSESPMDSKQLSSLIFLVRTLQEYYKIPNRRVIRHSEVPGKNTECPGLKFPWSEFKRHIL